MKVIKVDNFSRDNIADVLIAESLAPFWAKEIAELLNFKWSGDSSSDYFSAVPDEYKLRLAEY